MTKTYETKTIQREITSVLETKCDLCGEFVSGETWRQGPYEINDVEMAYERGSRYPDGSSCIEHVEFDICPDCFLTKVCPWMASQGVMPRRRTTES